MDLTSVRGIDASIASALRVARIVSVADLARAPDAGALANASGLPAAQIEQLREAAQQRIIDAFQQAGAGDEGALAAADAGALAQKTGIALRDVEWFQDAAREALGLEPAGARVVLWDGRPEARVEIAHGAFVVPIVTAGAKDDAEALLRKHRGDGVLLKEGSPHAQARLGGVVHAELPLFRDDGGKLTRVRVAAVRPRSATTEKRGDVFSGFKRKA